MHTPAPIVVRLVPRERSELLAHFLALEAEDRRLRFGAPIGDEVIATYVERIDFERDGVFGARDASLRLVGVVHAALFEGGSELGLSVLPDARGDGLGSALFARAIAHLRNRDVRQVMVHCLAENAAMRHLAKKHGMSAIHAGAESQARLAIDPPTPATRMDEWIEDQEAAAALAMRQGLRWFAPWMAANHVT